MVSFGQPTGAYPPEQKARTYMSSSKMLTPYQPTWRIRLGHSSTGTDPKVASLLPPGRQLSTGFCECVRPGDQLFFPSISVNDKTLNGFFNLGPFEDFPTPHCRILLFGSEMCGIDRCRFSPFEELALVSCGPENIRFWKVKARVLQGAMGVGASVV